jgi:hypothetical protein
MAKGNKKTVILIVISALVVAGVVVFVIYRKRKKMTENQVVPPVTKAAAVSAAVTSGYFSEYFPLRKGMFGDNVRALQAGLMLVGHDVGKWGTDGKFGDATLTAVRSAFKNPNKNEVTETEWKPYYNIYKVENNLPTITVV